MPYFTTITVINKEGRPVKAEVYCGGTSQGFTNENTGQITFTMNTSNRYSISAKRYGESASGEVNGGCETVLRLS
jgi:hypothetical protein